MDINLSWPHVFMAWGISALIAGGIYIHHQVYKAGENACEKRYEAAQAKGEQSHATIEKKVLSLSDKRLNDGLSHWLRK